MTAKDLKLGFVSAMPALGCALFAIGCIGDDALDDGTLEDEPLVIDDDTLVLDEQAPAPDEDWFQLVEAHALDPEGDVQAVTRRVHWSIRADFGNTTSQFGDGNAPDLYVHLQCGTGGTVIISDNSIVDFNDFTPEWFDFMVLRRTMSDSLARNCTINVQDHDSNADDPVGVTRSLRPLIDLTILAAARGGGNATGVGVFTVQASTNSFVRITVVRQVF